MLYYHAAFTIVAAFIVPAAISYVISPRTEHAPRKRFHEVGIAVFLQIGVIYAVMVAFVFTNVWDEFNKAGNSVHREALDLQNMADRAAYLPPEAANAVRAAIARYAESELNFEWPAMARRQASPETVNAFTQLFAAVAAVPNGDSLTYVTKNNLLSLVSDVRDMRALRLYQLDTDVPPWLWMLLIGSAILLVVFVMASVVGHRVVQSVLVGTFSAFLATILVTIHLLDFPFEGSIRINPQAIIYSIEHLNDIPVTLRKP